MNKKIFITTIFIISTFLCNELYAGIIYDELRKEIEITENKHGFDISFEKNIELLKKTKTTHLSHITGTYNKVDSCKIYLNEKSYNEIENRNISELNFFKIIHEIAHCISYKEINNKFGKTLFADRVHEVFSDTYAIAYLKINNNYFKKHKDILNAINKERSISRVNNENFIYDYGNYISTLRQSFEKMEINKENFIDSPYREIFSIIKKYDYKKDINFKEFSKKYNKLLILNE